MKGSVLVQSAVSPCMVLNNVMQVIHTFLLTDDVNSTDNPKNTTPCVMSANNTCGQESGGE